MISSFNDFYIKSPKNSLMTPFLLDQLLDLCCPILVWLKIRAVQAGEMSELQAGQFITRTLLLQSHVVGIDAVFPVKEALMPPHTIRDAGFELGADDQLDGPSPL